MIRTPCSVSELVFPATWLTLLYLALTDNSYILLSIVSHVLFNFFKTRGLTDSAPRSTGADLCRTEEEYVKFVFWVLEVVK